MLQTRSDLRMKELFDAIETHQYIADADDAESWMLEKEPLASNTEYGKDEDTAQVKFYSHFIEFEGFFCI